MTKSDVEVLRQQLLFWVCGDPAIAGVECQLPYAAHTRLAVLKRDEARKLINDFTGKLMQL